MPYDPQPYEMLTWGGAGNRQDYWRAHRGQWFLGVLDTHHKQVFMLPSDLEPPDQYEEDLEMRGTHISRPQPGVPEKGWLSRPMAGTRHQGVNSRPGLDQGGLRQHGRVVKAYGRVPDDCLGFAVIKMTQGFGEFRDRSNSLNSSSDKQQPPRKSPSARSYRMPEQWSNVLKQWLEDQLKVKLQHSLMP